MRTTLASITLALFHVIGCAGPASDDGAVSSEAAQTAGAEASNETASSTSKAVHEATFEDLASRLDTLVPGLRCEARGAWDDAESAFTVPCGDEEVVFHRWVRPATPGFMANVTRNQRQRVTPETEGLRQYMDASDAVMVKSIDAILVDSGQVPSGSCHPESYTSHVEENGTRVGLKSFKLPAGIEKHGMFTVAVSDVTVSLHFGLVGDGDVAESEAASGL